MWDGKCRAWSVKVRSAEREERSGECVKCGAQGVRCVECGL